MAVNPGGLTDPAGAVITRERLAYLRDQFAPDWHGLHGLPHWIRVRYIGLRLARETGANPVVVEWFALLHDAKRESDGHDTGHGARAAALARSLRKRWIDLSNEDFERLSYAIRHHSGGLADPDPTIQTCWDADRLDLGRVGTTPHPSRLGTPTARQPGFIAECLERSERWVAWRYGGGGRRLD